MYLSLRASPEGERGNLEFVLSLWIASSACEPPRNDKKGTFCINLLTRCYLICYIKYYWVFSHKHKDNIMGIEKIRRALDGGLVSDSEIRQWLVNSTDMTLRRRLEIGCIVNQADVEFGELKDWMDRIRECSQLPKETIKSWSVLELGEF